MPVKKKALRPPDSGARSGRNQVSGRTNTVIKKKHRTNGKLRGREGTRPPSREQAKKTTPLSHKAKTPEGRREKPIFAVIPKKAS